MNFEQQKAFDDLTKKIRTLSELAWDHKCHGKVVEDWLEDFDGSSGSSANEERLHALHLLSNFIFFGNREVGELLRSLYRDIFRYEIVQKIRLSNDNTLDVPQINQKLERELATTRFVPLGNPSESSNHLLYRFRQMNHLRPEQFVSPLALLQEPSVLRSLSCCIFIDDLSGTGKQAVRYSKESAIQQLTQQVRTEYHVLVATSRALDYVRDASTFNKVRCVIEVGDEYRAFSKDSLYYTGHKYPVSMFTMKKIALAYGKKVGQRPMGFGDSELILGFDHNVPNNTLPIFRASALGWHAPFPRANKQVG